MKDTTRDTILEAAAAEFSEHGFSGARMESIAKRSGFNKTLLYRHYNDKQGLFEEALRQQFSKRRQILQQLPEDLEQVVRAWFLQTAADPHFMRLIQREALQDQGQETVEEEARTEYYQRQIAMIEAYQKKGVLSSSLDSTPLFLAMLSLVVFPSTFPQITRLATGNSFDSPEFQEEWLSFLGSLLAHLKTSPKPE